MMDTDRAPSRLLLNQNSKRERRPMAIPTAILASAIIVAIGFLSSALIMQSGRNVPRYQLVSVGNGNTHKIDRETGAVELCFEAGCVPLETITEDAVVWDEPQ